MFSLETQGNIAMYIIIIILSFVLSVLTKIAFTNDDQKSSYSNYIYLFGPIILLCIPIIWMITILTRLGSINPSSISQLNTLHNYNYYALFFQILMVVGILSNIKHKKYISNGLLFMGILIIVTMANAWTINIYSQFINNNVTDDAFIPIEIQ